MSKMTEKEIRICNQLKNLVIARHNFDAALHTSKHLKSMGLSHENPLFSGIFTGLVVNYAKSFKANTGLANYNNHAQFTQFEDSNHLKTHEYLIEARDKLYAHIDVPHLKKKQESKTTNVEPYEVAVTIRDGSLLFRPCLVTNTNLVLDRVINLCLHQIKTSEEQIIQKAKLLNARRKYQIGEELILGENFP